VQWLFLQRSIIPLQPLYDGRDSVDRQKYLVVLNKYERFGKHFPELELTSQSMALTTPSTGSTARQRVSSITDCFLVYKIFSIFSQFLYSFCTLTTVFDRKILQIPFDWLSNLIQLCLTFIKEKYIKASQQ